MIYKVNVHITPKNLHAERKRVTTIWGGERNSIKPKEACYQGKKTPTSPVLCHGDKKGGGGGHMPALGWRFLTRNSFVTWLSAPGKKILRGACEERPFSLSTLLRFG